MRAETGSGSFGELGFWGIEDGGFAGDADWEDRLREESGGSMRSRRLRRRRSAAASSGVANERKRRETSGGGR